jgi:hypothetical protein
MADLSQVLKSKGIKASNKPVEKRNFHTEDVLEIYENKPAKTKPVSPPKLVKEKRIPESKNPPLTDPQFIEYPTLEMPLVISESSEHPSISATLGNPTKPSATSNNPSKPLDTPNNLTKPLATLSNPATPSATLVNTGINEPSFPFNPDNMEFLMLEGHGKKLMKVLIECGARNGPIMLGGLETRLKVGISSGHLASLIFKLTCRGFIKTRGFYRKRVFEVNPSIFK